MPKNQVCVKHGYKFVLNTMTYKYFNAANKYEIIHAAPDFFFNQSTLE